MPPNADPLLTDARWRVSVSPRTMVAALRAERRTTPRQLRLFACACVWRIYSILRDPRNKSGLVIAELAAEGKVTPNALAAARKEAQAVIDEGANGASGLAAIALQLALGNHRSALRAAEYATWAANLAWGDESRRIERAEEAAQADLLRDLFGDTVACSTMHLDVQTNELIGRLAHAAYDERLVPSCQLDPERLAVLSDALEEAGCSDAGVLNHLRSPGPHVRGCWALDLILGKS